MAVQDSYTFALAQSYDSQAGAWKFQTFTASSTYTLDKITLKIKASPSADNRDYYVRLYAVDGSSLPTGSVLAEYGSFNTGTFSTSYVEQDFDSGSYVLSNGTEYAIVIDTDDTYTGSQYSWFTDDEVAGYANGICGKGNHTGWVTISNDRWFKCYEPGTAPSKATNPSPANAATEVDFSTFSLSWDDGGGADTFDVWMGPDGSLVKVSSAQADTSYTSQLSECPTNQKIYWRIDSTNSEGTTTGDTWNFDPRPGQVSVHSPDTDETGWLLNDIQATWESPSANTTSYSVSYGTLSGFLSVVGTTSDLFINLRSSPFPLMGEIYYYRIDAVNQFGTTQGVEIAFTTLIQKLVSPTYYYYPFYYRLLPGGSHPPTGVEDTDYVVVGAPNFISTSRILTAIAMNKFWYEDL
jgi:hypothetical protein